MLIRVLWMLSVISFPSLAINSVQKLYQSVNHGVVELHVKSIALPKPGQVNYKQTTEASLGSGALISKEGRILTASHVVDKASSIEVIFSDGFKTTGHVVWVDSLIDLAMIQAAELPKKTKVLPLAESGDFNIGEQIVVIGAPYGVSHSLSVGYLSGIRERDEIPVSKIKPKFLQTDAAINKGNSGGPMFNLSGEIIGIVSHILSQSGGSQGLGFVVSIDTIKDVINSEPSNWSGFIPHLLSEKEAYALNISQGYGMLVQQIVPNTLADKLDFKGGNLNVMIGRKPVLVGGDVILDIGGIALDDLASVMKLRQEFSRYKKGDKVIFNFIRAGKPLSVTWEVD